jgi:hypothetical protein
MEIAALEAQITELVGQLNSLPAEDGALFMSALDAAAEAAFRRTCDLSVRPGARRLRDCA